MRILMTAVSLVTLGLAGGACAKQEGSCDALAVSLCEAHPEHCAAARGWIDTQGAGDAAARNEACTQLLADPRALATYNERFALATRPTPPPPGVPRPAGNAPPGTTQPRAKPTTRDGIRVIGENVEEIGKTGEKFGEALDKIEDAFDKKKDTSP